MHTKQVAVVIPIYKPQLNIEESISIERCIKVLGGKYDIFLMAPESLETKEYEQRYKITKIERFDNAFFASISSYNKLMLSACFYERFFDYKNILIYQTDAYVFNDQLEYWCNFEYDYIGAPWIKKQKYNKKKYQLYIYIRKLLWKYFSVTNPYRLINLVGNGGFSLRNVKSHYSVCISDSEILKKYIRKSEKELYNEDVFWSIEAPKILRSFKVPDYIEALKFSFDKSPEDAFKENNGNLPFGCHGWQKSRMIKFWKDKILTNNY